MNNMLAKDARRFKVTLTVCLVIAVLIAAALVYLATQFTAKFANDVSQKVYEANNAQLKVNTIKSLSNQLDKQSNTVDNVNRIVADASSYSYQDVIISDLNAIAKVAGVNITSFNFGDDSKTATSTANKSPVKKIAGLNYKTVDISLSNPMRYNNLLNFLHYIELNNTKMQIIDLVVSGPDLSSKDAQPTDANVSTLTLEVYVR